MVGLMAGMENLVRACLRADMCICRERTRAIEEEAIVAEGANARFLESGSITVKVG
jgi:hypothetical protein